MAQFNNFGTDCIREMEYLIPAKAEVLTAFPNLLEVPGATHEFWTTVDIAGADLYFFNAAGVALPYELVAIDTVATTGEYYVRSTLSNIANNYIYMLWDGSNNLGNTPTDTWSGSYHLVYHGQQGAGNWTDSTANGYTGTNTGVAAGVGKIGVCGDFERTESDRIANAAAGNWEYTQAWTVAAWTKRENVGYDAFIGIAGRSLGAATYRGWDFNSDGGSTAGRIGVVIRNNATPSLQVNAYTTNAYADTNWKHLAWSNSGSGTVAGQSVYVNGAGPVALTTSADTLAGNTIINAAAFSVGAVRNNLNFYDGLIDEVRIATVARSANWVAAEYSNTNDASAWSTLTTVPNIISIVPNSGQPGDPVTINVTGGLALQGAGTVTVGGVPIVITGWSWTVLTGNIPAGGVGPADVVLTNNDAHTDTDAGGWTFLPMGNVAQSHESITSIGIANSIGI
jgi:hypothetical protein